MTGHDTRDQEVRGYVRNRMAGEIPPEFVGNVMNDVHRTDQRRRNAAWPILTGLATVAAAVVIVVLGLNLLNRDGGVGAEATPTPSSTTASAEPSVSASAEASVSASAEVTPSARAEASADEGAFGPTHSMAPEDAFDNAQTCENPGGITTVGEQTDIRYRISFPGGWFTNAGTDTWAASRCSRPSGSSPETMGPFRRTSPSPPICRLVATSLPVDPQSRPGSTPSTASRQCDTRSSRRMVASSPTRPSCGSSQSRVPSRPKATTNRISRSPRHRQTLRSSLNAWTFWTA